MLFLQELRCELRKIAACSSSNAPTTSDGDPDLLANLALARKAAASGALFLGALAVACGAVKLPRQWVLGKRSTEPHYPAAAVWA